jgi:ATP-dependent Clp protease ATP-binding subunit ClpC
MFDRYSEAAKRVIFFARYEAAQMEFETIEPEHLLLGLLRDDRGLVKRILARHDVTRERIERAIESSYSTNHPASTSVQIPLSDESKRVLLRAASESEKLGEIEIDAEHLLLGLLSEERCSAALLLQRLGLQPGELGEHLAGRSRDPAWRRHQLVERRGAELAYADPSIRERLSESTRQQVEELLARTRTVENAAFAASARNELNEFAALHADALELRERLRRLLVD